MSWHQQRSWRFLFPSPMAFSLFPLYFVCFSYFSTYVLGVYTHYICSTLMLFNKVFSVFKFYVRIPCPYCGGVFVVTQNWCDLSMLVTIAWYEFLFMPPWHVCRSLHCTLSRWWFSLSMNKTFVQRVYSPQPPPARKVWQFCAFATPGIFRLHSFCQSDEYEKILFIFF